MKKLQNLRQNIEKIDKKIIELIKKRLNLSKKIAEEKLKNNLKIIDNFREKELQEVYKKTASALGISKKFIQKLFTLIIKESRYIQKQSQKIDDKAKK